MIQSEFVQLLHTVLGNNAVEMRAATERIQTMQQENLDSFLQICSNVFQENQVSDHARMMAGMLFRNAVRKTQGASWTSFDKKMREEIKDNFLKTLAEPIDRLRHTAGQVIAAIYVIELPLNEYNNTISVFAQNASNGDAEIKKSAIIGLLQLCQEFSDKEIKPDLETVNQLLSGIFFGLKTHEKLDISRLSVKALTNLLSFAKELFSRGTAHQEILKSLAKLITYNNADLRRDILEFLKEFVRSNYDLVKDFASEIWKMTSNFIAGEEKEIAMLATEVWINIIRHENKKPPEEAAIIPQVEKFLVSALVQNLMDEANYEGEQEEFNDEEYTIIHPTKTCLTLLAKHPSTRLREYIFNFLDNLTSENILESRVGLFIFSCLLQNAQDIQELPQQNLTGIIELMNNNSSIFVQQECGGILEKIAEISPQTYLQEPLSVQLLPLISRLVESDPRVSVPIMKVWQHLADYTSNHNINFDFKGVIEALLQNFSSSYERSFNSLVAETSKTLQAIFKGISDDQVKINYIIRIIEELKKPFEHHFEIEQRVASQTGLMNCLYPLLHKLPLSSLQDESSQMTIFKEIFQVIEELNEDFDENRTAAINLLGALVSTKNSIFHNFSHRVWSYIQKNLEVNEYSETFNLALRTLEELASSGSDGSAALLPKILEDFSHILFESEDFDEIHKSSVLASIGKIALSYKDCILPFVDQFNKIYDLAITDATKKDDSGELMLCVTESCFSFFKSLAIGSNDQAHWNLLPRVIECVKAASKEDNYPEENYLKNAVDFLGGVKDLCKGTEVEQSAIELIESITELLKQYEQDEDPESVMHE